MTKDRDFKRLVRSQMATTGQTYAAARAELAGRPVGAPAHDPDAMAAWNPSGSRIARNARIFVSGHEGLVGSAILRKLSDSGFERLVTATRDQLDLRDQAAVNYWFQANRPKYVVLAAGTVGGIAANVARPAEFLYDNMMIHATVVHASHAFGVAKLLYLGSSCIYPRDCRQPITEDQLLTGPLEPTNEGYALAKIAGIKLCEFYRRQYGDRFISAMPTNLYGPGDNFDLEDAHLVPMLMHRFHEAKQRGDTTLDVWGTGTPRRELMHVDDLADACLFLLDRYDEASHINVGTGQDLSIAEIAGLVRDVVHPGAELAFDPTKPDGMQRKLLDVTRMHRLGWHHRIDLGEGLRDMYEWFCAHPEARGRERSPAR